MVTIDPNPLDTFTYQLVSGTGATNNSLFSITGNQLFTAAVLNHTTQPSVSIRVRSTDSSGLSVEKVIVLPVLAPPAITRQPESREVFVGDSVTFFVETTGVEPLAYQWWKGSQPIPNANSRILELLGVALTDAGNYAVVVSNGDGSATSTAASLVVDPVSYGKWASSLPQTVASAVLEPNGDYNKDGIPNYLDFAFGVQTGLEMAFGAQPFISRDATGCVLTYREANGIASPIYRIMKSTDLVTWQEHQPALGEVTRTDKGVYTEVQVRVPSGDGKLFIRVQVSAQ